VSPDAVEGHGAINMSLVSDLPLFIDPFLLFNSEKTEYQVLHEEIIRYLRFFAIKRSGGVLIPLYSHPGTIFQKSNRPGLRSAGIRGAPRSDRRGFRVLGSPANLNVETLGTSHR